MIKKQVKQHLTTSATHLKIKVLETPGIKLSNSNTLIRDGIETGVVLKDFAQSLKRKNVPIPDIYCTLFDAAGITFNIVISRHAKKKERGAWIPSKI